MKAVRVALAAGLLVGAACGSAERPVASVPLAAMQAQHRSQDVASPVALGERDPLPMRERIVPTTRASRNRTGGGAGSAKPEASIGPRVPASNTEVGPRRSVSSTAYCVERVG